jgi:O-antigen ligase
MDLLLPIVAAIVAILILPGWSFYFDVTPKIVAVLAGAAVALIFLKPRWTRFTQILAVQAVALALATVFSIHRWFSLYGSTWRRGGLFAELAVFILALTQPKDLKGWLRITVLASIPIAIYAILQYFGTDPILPSGPYHFGEGKFQIVRPPATLGHAAYLATYLLYAIFAGAELARLEKTRAWKIAALTASALAFFAMVLSGTRAALVGFALGAIFVALRGHVNRRTVYAGAAVIVALAAFYASPFGERLRARVFWSSEDPLGGSRLTLWRDTLKMSLDRPLTGYGPETFSMEYPRHESIELARAFPDFYHESPHNIFLDAFASKGVLGLAAMVALAVYGLSVARGFLGAAFVAMLAAQQFTAFTLPTELYFYLVLTMLGQGAAMDRSLRSRLGSGLVIRTTLAATLALFAIYLATGDALLASARRALDQNNPDRAANFVDRARHWNAAADFYFSRRFASAPARDPVEHLRFWQYGFAAASSGPQTADDPQNALLNLAAFQARLNDARAVEQSLRQAIAIAPNWYKPHWLLAQVLQQQGRIDEARAEAGLAINRAGGKHPEVVTILNSLETR